MSQSTRSLSIKHPHASYSASLCPPRHPRGSRPSALVPPKADPQTSPPRLLVPLPSSPACAHRDPTLRLPAAPVPISCRDALPARTRPPCSSSTSCVFVRPCRSRGGAHLVLVLALVGRLASGIAPAVGLPACPAPAGRTAAAADEPGAELDARSQHGQRHVRRQRGGQKGRLPGRLQRCVCLVPLSLSLSLPGPCAWARRRERLGLTRELPCLVALGRAATDLLGSSKAPSIGKPYDPVHLTHVGFNNDTGECASLSRPV